MKLCIDKNVIKGYTKYKQIEMTNLKGDVRVIRIMAKIISIIGFLYFVGYALFADKITYPLLLGIVVAGVFFTVAYDMVKKVDEASNDWD